MSNQFANAAETVDIEASVVVGGGGSYTDPLKDSAEHGDVALVRFVSYIETGEQQSPGKFAKIVPQAMLKFEVVTPKHTTTSDDGKLITGSIDVTVNIGTNDGGNYVKFFRAMNWSQKHKHFAQMLGEAFLVPKLLLNTKGEKTYINISSKDEGVQLAAPLNKDAMTGLTTPIAAPEATRKLQCLIFDNPTTEQWDSIFIEGEKEDGTSKNWIQNKIKGAVNFAGSGVEQFLAAAGVELPDPAANAEHKPDASASNSALDQL